MGEQNIGVAPSNGLNATPEKVVKDTKDKSSFYGMLILLVVILIAAAGYLVLQQLRIEQEGLGGAVDKGDRRIATLHDQLASLESQMSTLQKQMATLQSNLETRESKLERQLAEFRQFHGSQLSATKAELADSINKIQNHLNKTRGDWMIADAEYLMGVAIQRLNLVGDVKTSLVALNAADERLRDSGNPGVYKVREQLAREIYALKKVNPFDVVGAFAKIRNLESLVEALPTRLPHVGAVLKEFKPESDGEAKKSSGIGDLFNLKNLVEIRRSEEAISVVLQPEEVRIIRQDLKIKLEMLRLALVERDAKLFLNNIQDARSWLKTHFRADSAETRQFDAQLQEFEQAGLEMNYPDISGSLKMLQNLASLRVESDKAKSAQAPARDGEKTQAEQAQDRKPEGARP
ncbi:MAG: uroporphyrinogen-III C-methyltransferase [Methylococcales bacterium]